MDHDGGTMIIQLEILIMNNDSVFMMIRYDDYDDNDYYGHFQLLISLVTFAPMLVLHSP